VLRFTRTQFDGYCARLGIAMLLVPLPSLVFAQASPILTGATSMQSNVYAWLTPVAILAVMGLAVAALANRISWGWSLGIILGIALGFGAPQILVWVRGMFAV
jgi:type IV secretory pathway VirB2 component (pilin)